MAIVYKILYQNSEGSDFHDIKHDDHPGDFVTDLRISLGDHVDEVEAYLVGVPDDRTRPWFIENIEIE